MSFSPHTTVTSTPIASTAIGSLANLNTFLKSLTQELHHGPNISVMCSVKQNDEPEIVHDDLLEQRLEKKMNVQLSVVPPAADQRIKLPVPPATFTSRDSEPNPLFLSLVIAGETTRRIFGGVGLYHLNQRKPDLLHIIEGSNFSPVVNIMSGRTVSIGFKFSKYPRQCDSSEEAFRVVATLHDCSGKLVAYGLSAFAYSVKAHPRSTKRSLQTSANESEDIGPTRTKRRRIATTSTSIAGHNTPLSPAVGSLGPQESGDSANTGVLPVVGPTVDRSGGVPRPMIDPHFQPLPHEPYPLLRLNHSEAYQLDPTLDEVLPPSCSWRGGIFITLFVSNLPQDGLIYARFGFVVVRTDRKTPHTLACRVPAASGPCEVEVTLSKSSGSFDAPYGVSLCKFTYEEDDITKLIRSLKAAADDSNSFKWQAATSIQEYAMTNRLIPSRSHVTQSTYDQSALGQLWSVGHARIEAVEEMDKDGNDTAQPEPSKSVSDLETKSHGTPDIEDKCSDANGVESLGSRQTVMKQDAKLSDTTARDDSQGYTTLRTISTPKVSSTSNVKKPATHNMPNSPPSGVQNLRRARPPSPNQAPFGVGKTNQQPFERAPPTHCQPPNLQANTSPIGVGN